MHITASTEGTARSGSAMPTGGIATVAVAAAMVADTAADMLPAMHGGGTWGRGGRGRRN
jgi:hypothetical protein